MNINNSINMCAGLLFAAVLSGCGGGGGGGGGGGPGTDSVSTDIHGIHVGAFSNSFITHVTFVLDNEEFYTMYGIPSGGVLTATGFLQGNGTLSNGSFSSLNLKDFSISGPAKSGTLSASFDPGVSLNGSFSLSGTSTVTFFTSAPLKNSRYNFSTAANPANITGVWNLKDMQSNDVALNVAADGSFTGSYSGVCSFNGTMKPRVSGKNVFDLAFTYTGPSCTSPPEQISGIAIEYLLADGRRQFVVAGANAARTVGASFLGTRTH